MPVFRVGNLSRTQRVLLVAAGIEELLQKARKKLELPETATLILTENDGLEVDEEEILLSLSKDEKLIVCEPEEKCQYEDILAASSQGEAAGSDTPAISSNSQVSPPEGASLSAGPSEDGQRTTEQSEAVSPNEGAAYETESAEETASATMEPPNPSPSTSSMSGCSSPANQVSQVPLKPWKKPYQFPVKNLPQNLQDHLREKKPMDTSQRKMFLSVLYEDVTKFTFYPVPDQYSDIIRGILMRWPHLASVANMEGTDTMSYWRTKIREKFCNARKRRDRQQPLVKSRVLGKRKKKETTSEEPPNKNAKAWYGVVNYLPERPPGEDASSIKIHIEWMKEEKRVRPRRPDYAKIKTCMARTLADRREMVVLQGASITTILETFPWLGDEDELADEFQRLTGKDLSQQVQDFSQKYGKAIIQMVQKTDEKKRKPLVKAYVEHLQSLRTEDERKAVMPAVAFCGLQALFKEDSACFMSTDEIQDEPVHLVYDGANMDGPFDLTIDSVLVCRPKSAKKAVVTFLAASYVFNLAYSGKLANTHIFAQKIILKLDNGSEEHARTRLFKDRYRAVLSMIDKLNSVM